jgi:dihydroflavonol-4-reductase
MKLITGANGRIGNVLVRELNKRGEGVKILIRKTSDLKSLEGLTYEPVYGDVLKPETVVSALEGIDTIFHLAGYINITSSYQDETYDVNIQGTKNIADICLEKGLNLVYTSSIHAILSPEDGSVIDESTPLATNELGKRGLYDYSKAVATQYVVDKIKEGLKAIILHPTGVVGPFDFEPSLFGNGIIEFIKSNAKSTIPGHFDYVDVRDVVNGILKAYDLKKYGERYILGGEDLNMADYAKYIHEFANIPGETKMMSLNLAYILGYILPLFTKNSQITTYSVKTLQSNSNVNIDKARKELGYSPRSVKESLKDQYEWFKSHGYLD